MTQYKYNTLKKSNNQGVLCPTCSQLFTPMNLNEDDLFTMEKKIESLKRILWYLSYFNFVIFLSIMTSVLFNMMMYSILCGVQFLSMSVFVYFIQRYFILEGYFTDVSRTREMMGSDVECIV